MDICIVGLGLIGGSLAKAISARTKHVCLGIDADKETCRKALECGAAKKIIEPQNMAEADVVILALPPKQLVDFFEQNAKHMRQGALVFDTCGVKQTIIAKCAPIAQKCGLRFVGAHPMAGREFSGFDYSLENLFDKASFIVATDHAEQSAIDEACALAKEIGFADVTITDAERHDRVIAYTSQLAHIVSNAYCKSDTIHRRKGFCAGSFSDMTRVGKLDVALWTQLFLSNQQDLSLELDNLIEKLEQFRQALAAKDAKELSRLLKEGNDIKVASLSEEK